MAFPSTVSSFSNPNPSDRLNSPSHSSVESAQNTGLTEIQTFVGTLSSTAGTLMYDIRSSNSNGGGHVQTAAKGGTGQTSFTKGDLLVASGASVISKLAVGSDNQVLQANSSAATGVNWVNSSNPKIATSASVITILNTTETSVLSTTIPGSTLGTSNAIRTTLFVPVWNPEPGVSVLTAVHWGGGRVASILLTSNASPSASMVGKFTHTMIANNSSVLQRHFLEAEFLAKTNAPGAWDNIVFSPTVFEVGASSIVTVAAKITNTSSVNSAANRTYGMTIKLTGPVARDINTGGYIVEKIT